MTEKSNRHDPCQHLKEQFVDALTGEMNPEQEADFRARLAQEPECQEAFEAMRATLDLIEKPRRPDPGIDFWETFPARVEAALSDQEGSATVHRLPTWQSWTLRAVAAAAILLIGVGIGRWFLPDRGSPQLAAIEPKSEAQQLTEQTYAHFQKSKTLLQGLVNLDTENTGDNTDLALFQNTSRRLVHESIYLRSALSESGNPRLNDLVRDLEVILSLLANQEGTEDGKIVEIIRDSVDRSAIFLKINLEELYRLKEAENEKKRSAA